MKFNNRETALAFKKMTKDNIDYVKQFMEFEKTSLTDHKRDGGLVNVPEWKRSLNHCCSMLNGLTAQQIFYDYYGKAKGFIPIGDLRNWGDRDPKDIGKCDFHCGDVQIEFKYTDYHYESEDDFKNYVIERINDEIEWIFYYHEADIVYYWRPNSFIPLYKVFKENGKWKIVNEELNPYDEIKMNTEWLKYKVQKERCNEQYQNIHYRNLTK